MENILLKLIQAAGDNIAAAERGILFIDEIDKIAHKGENVSITRDVSGEGVQQALLKIIEGTVASVPQQGGRKHPNQEMLKINTENILIICGGAFVGLDKIVQSRVAEHHLGFGADIKKNRELKMSELFGQIHPDDLIKFGLIPEFIGRLPIQVALDELTEEDLIRVVTEPRNAVTRQYAASMEMDGVELEFSEDAVKAIAQKAIKRKTGARGIRSIIESVMVDAMFELPSRKGRKKLIINKAVIDGGEKPQILKLGDSDNPNEIKQITA